MSAARPHFRLSYEVKRTFLHHLRHLLRECTYLPDPAARKYFHHHILERFRDYRPGDRKDSFRQPAQKWILDERDQVRCLHECRKKISFLYRAGIGDITALKRVLHNTYGRSGKRRHELLKPYLQPDVPKDSTTLQEPSKEVAFDVLDLPEALTLLGQSQSRQTIRGSTRDIVSFKKYTKPVLPATNTWGRSMPRKRVVNAKRQRYNKLLDKILPPIPEDEWIRLRGLAAGQISNDGPPPRRVRLAGLPELPSLRDRHILTTRFMRRLWANIFLQCPKMEWDAVKRKWSIVWGNVDEIRPKDARAVNGDSELFS